MKPKSLPALLQISSMISKFFCISGLSFLYFPYPWGFQRVLLLHSSRREGYALPGQNEWMVCAQGNLISVKCPVLGASLCSTFAMETVNVSVNLKASVWYSRPGWRGEQLGKKQGKQERRTSGFPSLLWVRCLYLSEHWRKTDGEAELLQVPGAVPVIINTALPCLCPAQRWSVHSWLCMCLYNPREHHSHS